MDTPISDSPLSLKEAYDVYNKHTESAHKLWAYFSAVSLAVLGYTIGKEKLDWDGSMYFLIGGCYLIFSLSNLWILRITQNECVLFAGVFNEAAEQIYGKEAEIAVVSASKNKVSFFHAFAQLTIVASIILTWCYQPDAKAAEEGKQCKRAAAAVSPAGR